MWDPSHNPPAKTGMTGRESSKKEDQIGPHLLAIVRAAKPVGDDRRPTDLRRSSKQPGYQADANGEPRR